jgi:uncharacterized tellurite resistance protein B-like protein
MLSPEKKTILQLLVALAWADGHVDEEEMDIVNALSDAFNTSKEESEEIAQWAKTKRSLDDVNIDNLEQSDKILALQYGVLLTYIDGEQSAGEKEMLNGLIKKFNMKDEEIKPVLDSANAFAKSLLPELDS